MLFVAFFPLEKSFFFLFFLLFFYPGSLQIYSLVNYIFQATRRESKCHFFFSTLGELLKALYTFLLNTMNPRSITHFLRNFPIS